MVNQGSVFIQGLIIGMLLKCVDRTEMDKSFDIAFPGNIQHIPGSFSIDTRNHSVRISVYGYPGREMENDVNILKQQFD
jgi:hypothetical protein